MTYTKRDKLIIEFLERELVERMGIGEGHIVGKRFIIKRTQLILNDLKHKMKNHKLK